MRTLLLKTMWIAALIGACGVVSAQTADVPDAVEFSDRPQPCYVVIAVDVSGNMESSDSPESGSKHRTFRDEGQLVFLQILPFLRSDLYVGVAHFSDKVRYSLPSEDTGPLLPWGQTFLPESACRNMVRPAEFMAAFDTDIAESLSWASDRIAAARQQYGPGSAKVIVLTNGDPRDSARELDRGRGPLQSMAKRFAELQIQAYPILINGASLRSLDKQSRLSADEIAAEDLMRSVALTTGGKAYRLSRELGFADILMDVFGLGIEIRSSEATDRAQGSDWLVSRHDWAIVAVGEPVASATMEPVGGSDRTPHTLTVDGNLEAGSGIRANVIASSWQQATILRRPEAADFVDRFWQGKWTLGATGTGSSPAVRLYRIPDFLVQLQLEPELPWWRYEQVKAKASLLERHKKGPDLRVAAGGGTDLSIGIKAVSSDEKDSVDVSQGRWTLPSQVYETGAFSIGTPGLYRLTCELRHRVGDVNVPLLRLANDVYVHSECVAVQVVNAATNDVLGEAPATADATLKIDLPGGQDVYFRIVGKGEFKVEPQLGSFHLEPLLQADWPLHKDDQGNLVTDSVHLVEGEEQLVGQADLEVRTQAGVRHIRLPRFDLVYPPAPLRLECRFTDAREALWVGEFHKQPLVISAFPVFESFRDAILQRFPDAMPEARTRTVDMQSGTTQMTKLQSRVLNPAQTEGPQGRTVAATYFVESTIPIPSANRCEIELGSVMEGLQGTTKTYGIVDPVSQGLFKWAVTQPGQPLSRQGAVSETLFCGEPIQFHAEWRADQNISAVRFEFPKTDSNEPIFVEMPVTAGARQADLEQVVGGLSLGKMLPVYVHVTLQPSGGDRPLQIKLNGGQFRADDRRVVLEDLRAGEGGPTDITGFAWEPVEIPLRAVFTGYVATDARHNAAIEQFKKSCVVTVAPRTGDVRNISDTIEWTSVSSPEGPSKRCELIGHATYTPDVPGRASIEATADTPAVQGGGEASPRRAYAHLLAKSPRLAVTIQKITPTGDEPVFDSRRWSAGEGGVSALETRFSARLRVDVRPSDWAATGQSRPWRTAIRLLRRATSEAEWSSEFSDASELTAEGTFLRDVQIAGNGEYALEVSGTDLQSGRRTAFLLTPVIATIRPHEIKPTVAPPAWVTSRVRQWPFEYQVTLQQEAADSSQSQALAFQFQLPGQTQTWMDGTVSSMPSQTPEARQLLVKGPRFLPASQGLQNGKVQFKLSSQGLDLLSWDCPDIRVIPPVLERLALSGRSDGDAIALTGVELVSDGSTELWVRPQFRAAPELEGQWTPAESTVYLWRSRADEAPGGQADVRFLENLQDRGDSGVHAFPIENPASGGAVKAIPRHAKLRLWGWPRRPASERYSLVASVVYRPTAGAAAERMIAEWSDIYAVQVNTPWVVPLIWWPVAAILVGAIVTTFLRLFVPNPSHLPLDMRLEENIAVVEPVRLDNPVLVDLQETSFVKDVQMRTRYLRSQWNGSVLAWIAGPLQVFLRRALCPRRWAWMAVIPRIRGDAKGVRTGLICVWTGLGARGGRVWSKGSGSQRLPQEGQIKTVHLDLPYRVDNVGRTMRVTIRIGKLVHRELL